MPKLDLTHIAERLKARLADLKDGKEVAAREVRALLNDEQLTAMDKAWVEQLELRKNSTARTKEEKKAQGWKKIREIYIAAYEIALIEATELQVDAWEKKQRDAEIRQAKIYMDSYSKAIKDGKDNTTAKNIANNDLTRAGLKRLDGEVVGHINKRNREVNAMEDALREQLKDE